MWLGHQWSLSPRGRNEQQIYDLPDPDGWESKDILLWNDVQMTDVQKNAVLETFIISNI